MPDRARQAPRVANGYNHKAKTIADAQRLAAGGWNPSDISRLIGVPRQTICYWVQPKEATRKRRLQARQRAAVRIRALMGIGISQPDIAKIMTLDTGEEWTVGKVRYTVQTT